MDAKTNGALPASPVPLNPGETYKSHGNADGLTKREAFAMAAMQGLCTINTIGRDDGIGSHKHGEWVESLTADAVVIADRLLTALSQEPQ